MNGNPEFQAILQKYPVGIGDQALSDEPAPAVFWSILHGAGIHTIAPDRASDPREMAEKMLELVGSNTAFVLVPGQRFDTLGTRHGRGGGWYDRFLHALPQQWLRVVVCDREQCSETPRRRQECDELMDVVGGIDRDTEIVGWHETHARDV